ncbi:sensory box sensor histidine kinase/response regulator [Legionella beliardensis]|uniref:histidine kinase n=1 Tax=Legionella beliardensis TaxID=91822 RepID=A0A378HXX0_9GAMM|nr:ATP-binding protein [Legionella beliardensis]STX27543.1 sensory box sensor histidine kinase/response regulator [Legionella beliardensis]
MDADTVTDFKKWLEEKELEIKKLQSYLESERKRFQDNLKEAQEYYESILALMPGHVYWLDRDNVFLGCNDLQAKSARLASRKEIVGKTNYDMPWKDQADELNRLNNLVMESGVPHTAEEYAVMADGMSIHLSNKTPLRDKHDQIIGVLGVSIDITERKKLEVTLKRAKEKAELANRAKTELITNISHDICASLNGINGLSTHLEAQLVQLEEKQQARLIKESSTQLLQIIKEISDSLTHCPLTDNEIVQEPTDLNKVIADITQLYYPAIKMKNLEFNVDVANSIPPILMDKVKLHRVLMNLITNSLYYTESGSITIKVEKVATDNIYLQLRFSIIDTGREIPHDLQDQLAHPDFSSDDESHYLSQDLHIAQKYVGLLGGELKLISEPNCGSKVYFVLSLKILTD